MISLQNNMEKIINDNITFILLIFLAGDADSSQAPGLTSGLMGSVNIHRGALLFVPQ